MNRRYTLEERKTAVAEYRRTKSITKTVRNLGFPGRWTLHQWIREPLKPGPKPKKMPQTLRNYPWTVKLEAVQLLREGLRPPEIAVRLDIKTHMNVYAWAQIFRKSGQWGLMSKKERRAQQEFPTRASLEASLPDDPAELRKLATKLMVEKALLNEELTLIKKDESVMPGNLTNRQKTLVIDALRHAYPLLMLLESMGLSTSSYYYQLKTMSKPDPFAHLRQRIHHHAVQGRFTYGYRRIWWALRHEGLIVSEKVVRRLMGEENIAVRIPARKRRYSSYDGEISPAPENLVKRNFHADKPRELWLTDISEFSARNGKIYLSAIIDCFDGMVVGWRTGKHPTMDLAENTLTDALDLFPPAPDQRLVIHSDRGTHYRSNSWITMTRAANLTRSMSKKGCSPDNSACEGFFGRLKNEMFYFRSWNDVDELDRAINDYIEFYNNVRIKESLGGLSIAGYRALVA